MTKSRRREIHQRSFDGVSAVCGMFIGFINFPPLLWSVSARLWGMVTCRRCLRILEPDQ